VQQDVTRRAWIGFLQLRFQAEFADQCEQLRRALKALRAGFEDHSILCDGIDHATRGGARFENSDLEAQL
jgi:hypothetical protein